MTLFLLSLLSFLPCSSHLSYKGWHSITIYKEVFCSMKGTVKFFHDQKKYGFIETEDMDDDLFFHVSDLEEGDSIEEDVEVEFDQEEGDRGPKATNVVEA